MKKELMLINVSIVLLAMLVFIIFMLFSFIFVSLNEDINELKNIKEAHKSLEFDKESINSTENIVLGHNGLYIVDSVSKRCVKLIKEQ